MVKRILFISALLFSWVSVFSCTNFMAGKNATVDGSTLVSYSADSYSIYGALYYYPAATYTEGTMLKIYEWDTGKYLGKIKQVQRTYTVVGNMNEHQLTIAETTFGGRHELVDTTAILDYGNLMYLTLQRARTAREAIRTMADLVAQYGYCSEGESFSIADPQDVWIMEMVGKGVGNKGAVWVARRIPDDCISGHANQARITHFPFNDPENCIYSGDVVLFAREKGYFKGINRDFSFSDVYAPLDYVALRACEARVWSIFSKVDTAMYKYLSYVKGETLQRMPLWVKPNKKLSVKDFRAFMRDQFEGTEFDMTKGVFSEPFGSKLRCSPLTFKVDGVEYMHDRPIATQQTGFTFIAQMRSWLPNYIGGVLWFGVDDAASNIYVPMYCGIKSVPHCFDKNNGNLLEYSPTSAFWIYNWVANFAYTKYSYMMPHIKKVQSEWEYGFDMRMPQIDKEALSMPEDKAREFLTDFSRAQAEGSTAAWKKLGEYLFVKYLDGVVKKEENGEFLQNEFHIPTSVTRVGYSKENLQRIVDEEPNRKVQEVMK